ncbi:hypothetical protein A3C23_00210 [Candidatus Roizmanbacteria bacterium RIFCSPHIGHO2_02_FULL_37_13b]|uniref:Aminotransferase n=1 Tax=Candidatus Roizmanbacteria bacterium RIFCSPLOWO2_02_FULL_36_11 TaxID=1802071 RepID=A0A1F7JHQ1_9BACT|nr:MAG: hypothetical protein A3C23_00210 [Candidatus Roizmanbacteria bacterium RIFCSPHIGHO2_02_FULL_37_13b]OGK55122.1 MAG: hypothetical protein A3H78_04020 [Candidatus Roizmanbacteria bacterium RIFCSPLOWO2_02_FULL_36_11]
MKPFSKSINRIGTETAFVVGPEISSWVKKGFDIIKVNIGEPGCNIKEAATKAAIQSFKHHETHYMPSAGLTSLRTKIAEYMSASRKVDYRKNDIILCPGGKPVIAGTILILVNQGEEVVYPTPSYPIYESMVDFVGAKGIPIEIKEENGFNFDIKDLRKLVNKKTKLLILNSPSNPTGGVIDKEELEEIAELAEKYDFYILSDEVYSRIVYGDAFDKIFYKGNKLPISPSIASLKNMSQRTIILDGFSKTYAMTGLRLGYVCCSNNDFMKQFLTYAINFWSCLPQPLMAAAEAVLSKDQSEAQHEIELYEKKHDIAVKMLNEIDGVSCHNSSGAFYLFPNVTKACKKLGFKDAEAMRKYLLTYDKKNKKGVAVLSRIHFGRRLASEKEEYIRISTAGKMDDIKEGIRRIKIAIEK